MNLRSLKTKRLWIRAPITRSKRSRTDKACAHQDAQRLAAPGARVRNTAAGLRYVLYLYLSDLREPWRVTHRPGGYFLAPVGEERVGDVSNVTFSNGWVCRSDGVVFIYYASSDTRCHVATSTVDRLLDYVMNTPEDGLRSAASVAQRIELARRNLSRAN